MGKKSEQYKDEAYVANYKEMVKKLQVLSRVAVRQFLGTRPDGDPRLEYMANIEAFVNLANVQLEVLLGLTVQKLGIPREDYLKAQTTSITTQIQTMEKDLAVKSWDQSGNPVFDLQAYLERTALWPK